MAEDNLYKTPQDRISAIQDAEAMSRADEAKAAVLRSRAMRVGSDTLSKAADDADNKLAESNKKLQEAVEKGVVLDLSGTAPTLSDSNGNFAPNLEVARTGGVGVAASNSTEGGDVAESVDAVSLEPAKSGITDGNRMIGEGEELEKAAREGAISSGEGKTPAMQDNTSLNSTANSQTNSGASAKTEGNAGATASSKTADKSKSDK